MRPQVLPMPDEHPWLDNATDRTKGDPWCTIPGYGGSKTLMEGMTKFVCRQNPQLDIINSLKLAGWHYCSLEKKNEGETDRLLPDLFLVGHGEE